MYAIFIIQILFKVIQIRSSFILILGVFCLLLGSENLSAQKLTTKSKKAEALYKKATSFYANNQFELAKESLYQAIKKDDAFIEAYILLSEVFFEQEEYAKEAELLEQVIAMDSTFFIYSYYSLGVANFHLSKYDKAADWFYKYYSKSNNPKSKQRVEEWIERVKFAKDAKEKPKHVRPVNLGTNINSKYNDYWPSITADENILVFTVMVARDSAITDKPYANAIANYYHEDFYRSVKDESGEWSTREKLSPPINSDHNEGAQALSADGNWMFFTACGRKDGKGSCDIYFSRRTNHGWSDPVNIGAPVNTPYWESQPSFSSDGRTLYFASNRAGGKGGRDIWRSRIIGLKPDGTPFFGKVENLGNLVNTHNEEKSPFIHPDNITLYYASSGLPGMGQMDLYLTKINENGSFSKPVNLGYPINTSADEVGLVVTASGKKAYFSSEREGDSFGGKDIYSFELPPDIQPNPVSYVKGRVFDIRTRERLSATFELKDLETRKMVVEALSTDFSGEFLVCLPIGGSYALNVSKPGYLFYSDHFNMDSTASHLNPRVIDIYLKPIKVGEQVVLKNVFFETDSYQLMSQSELELNKIVDFMKLNDKVKIQLIGYTDNVGTADYNLNLSNKRAHQVYQYLVTAGIKEARLSYKGEGMNNPVESNDTEEGRSKNRRTEMKIVE
ncbi:tetratricopeptide repeat protein [Labilibacter sediminis]|nr:tetratricopeptide repeat protein [Labilibacter sediminis]